MNLTEIITKVLSDSQIDLVLTENGYDWAPKNNNGSTQYLSLLDREGMLRRTAEVEPDAEGLAEWVSDNIRKWILNKRYNVYHLLGPYDERLGFLDALLKKF